MNAETGFGTAGAAPRPITILRLPRAERPARRGTWPAIAALLIAAAFAIRWQQFGNPLIQVDENFYLLVGDRMLHGALPYVDIWDRKPIGLFLLYAAIRLLGGDGIIEYQVVATLFAGGTAFLIARIARRIATPAAAAVAGILYLLMLGLAGGTGGQAPVFYNLFVAGAALATLEAWSLPRPSAVRLRRLGIGAMALIGIAMQIKYTALFEGVFFGVALLMVGWWVKPSLGALALSAGLWIATALLPTAAALGYYSWAGHADAFVYANFLSIGGRSTAGAGELLSRLGHSWIALHLPLFCVLLSGVLAPWRQRPASARSFGFVMAWLAAALFGYFVFGTYFDHYALPLMVPIAVGCAPLFAYRPQHIGMIAATVMLLLGAVAYRGAVIANLHKRGGAATMEAMVAAIRPRLDRATRAGLFVYDGDSLLYYLTRAPIPTRFAFPQHLHLQREADAIGADPLAEIRRVLAGRPRVVVDAIDPAERDENAAANQLVRGVLARDYRLVATVAQRKRLVLIYGRR